MLLERFIGVDRMPLRDFGAWAVLGNRPKLDAQISNGSDVRRLGRRSVQSAGHAVAKLVVSLLGTGTPTSLELGNFAEIANLEVV